KNTDHSYNFNPEGEIRLVFALAKMGYVLKSSRIKSCLLGYRFVPLDGSRLTFVLVKDESRLAFALNKVGYVLEIVKLDYIHR
ncbi:15106_t:CDS:2, partial [Dentiscutata heterogama]